MEHWNIEHRTLEHTTQNTRKEKITTLEHWNREHQNIRTLEQ